MADGIEQRVGENSFADDEITVVRSIPLVRAGERPTLVQYLAEFQGNYIRGRKLLRKNGSLAALYEGGEWKPYAIPDELSAYSRETSRGQRE